MAKCTTNGKEYAFSVGEMKSIHITTDGKTTHAVLKDGNKVVKRSKAICNPADTFDFEIGARVAFDRLTEPELPKFTYAGFKRGDFIVNCRTQEEANIFCAYLHGKGDKWSTQKSYIRNTKWSSYQENTCYSGDGIYCEKAFYEPMGRIIIPFNAADLD